MDKVLRCECGFEARAAREDELVADVRRHAWEAHGMSLSHEEAVLLAFRAELAQGAPHTVSFDTTARAERKGAK